MKPGLRVLAVTVFCVLVEHDEVIEQSHRRARWDGIGFLVHRQARRGVEGVHAQYAAQLCAQAAPVIVVAASAAPAGPEHPREKPASRTGRLAVVGNRGLARPGTAIQRFWPNNTQDCPE